MYLAGQRVSLRSHHGKYLMAFPDGSVRWTSASPEASGTFIVQPVGNGKVAFQTFYGKYLTALPSGGLSANSISATANEQFIIINVNGRVDLFTMYTSHRAYVSVQPNGTIEKRSVPKTWEAIQIGLVLN